MCGRFVAITDPDGLSRFFVVDERKAEDLPARYNVAPTQAVFAIAEHRRARLLVSFTWGLVPRWARERRNGPPLINARAETVADRPAFRDAFRRRRCLIPADGFYEWRRDGGRRVAHFIRHVGGRTLAFAGLWDTWRDPAHPDAPPLRTCAIVTTVANEGLRPLHDRMPVILPSDAWDVWLDPDHGDEMLLRPLLAPADEGLLTFHPVSAEVNDHRNDHRGLVEPVTA
jgi:putative SOS response-associated peptidase YedK